MNDKNDIRRISPLTETVDRRGFIRNTAIAGGGLALGLNQAQASESSIDGLQTRILGRTGEKVTVLGLGTAPIGEGPIDVPEATKIFGEVMDRGVNYIDTAYIYGNAEEALGNLVPQRRDKLFLVTKVWTDSAEGAEKHLSTSLKRLKTDYADLVHIHHIGGKDIDKVLADDGVLKYLLKQQKAGRLRYIGLSGHAGSSRFLRMLDTGKIDVIMPVLNYADRNIYEFERRVLPVARKMNVGVAAMKVYAGIKGGFPNHKKGFVGCVTEADKLQKALAYALDLEGVSVAVIGPYTLEQAIQNVEYARKYKPLTETERASLVAYGVDLAKELGPRYGKET